MNAVSAAGRPSSPPGSFRLSKPPDRLPSSCFLHQVRCSRRVDRSGCWGRSGCGRARTQIGAGGLVAAGSVLRAPSAVFLAVTGPSGGRPQRHFHGTEPPGGVGARAGPGSPRPERVLGALCFLVFACATLLTSCTYTSDFVLLRRLFQQ